ncbi:MAG: TlpA family protein disulfide reductase [Marinilabiliaceae bacterium]|nr:TlpA family protein disulfide reductase [Marinilabiliaceae bacterium]
MRYILLGCFFVLLFTQCKKEGATIAFRLKTTKESPLLMYKGNKNNQSVDTVKFNDKQSVTLVLQQSELEELVFRFERTWITPIINNGEEMQIEISSDQDGINVTYSGDHADLNNYRYECTKVLGYGLVRQFYSDSEQQYPFTFYAAKLDSMQAAWLKRLRGIDEIAETELDEEAQYLTYFFNYVKSSFPWYIPLKNGKSVKSDPDFVQFIEEMEECPETESSKFYYPTFDLKVRWLATGLQEEEKWGEEYTLKMLQLIDKTISSVSLKDQMLTKCIDSYLSYAVNVNLHKTFSLYGDLCSNEEYKSGLEVKFKNAERIVPGAEAPDFDFYTASGEHKKLSDFKGKYVYIDVWATWCGPCKAELPYLTIIHKTLNNKSNLEIISVSVDKDKKAWEKMVDKKQLEWPQYIVKEAFKSVLTKQYNINSIPRFILIDPQGKIVSTVADRPSNEQLLPYLRDL